MQAELAIAAPPVTTKRIGQAELRILVPSAVLLLIICACFLGPVLIHMPSPSAGALAQANLPPLSRGHVLGTDSLGNDLLSRSLYGGRISIEVGLGAVALGMVVGGILGIVAGYLGRGIDSVIMRILDVLLAFPSLVLALTVSTYLGPNEQDVIIAISCFMVPAYARMARGITLKLLSQEFVIASKLSGGSTLYVMSRCILPNVVPPLLSYGFVSVAIAIIIEATLSFLGLGVPPPQPSWGVMISSAQPYLSTAPWMVIVPSAFLFVTILSLNLLGDGVRARLDYVR